MAGDSIQPTYEELKQQELASLLDDMRRIQPTYEELKPFFSAGLGEVVLGIQPTYEELKRIFSFLSLSILVVSSLPMRN